MLNQTSLFVRALIVVLLAFATPSVNASYIEIGTSDSANRFPFDRVYGNGEYQQIYNRAAFPDTVTISEVAFASGGPFSIPAIVAYNLTVALSTAATSVGSPIANFSANKGADFTVVFSGLVIADLAIAHNFDLVVPFGIPFTYFPSNGDLLLDVVVNFNSAPIGILGFDAGFTSDISRIYRNPFTSNVETDDRYGLRTRFAVAIPEPAVLALLGLGLAALAASRRRKLI